MVPGGRTVVAGEDRQSGDGQVGGPLRENARRRGITTALMDRVRQAATEAGCPRVEWTADQDNPTALAFYRALGIRPHNGKALYRIEQTR
ncbi:GNAT family N-acetyltransferase [Streptomyces aureoversilis]|uniref:GNAT family N-acetyltransferase n=1 Tax=Streptomyces aureoversilis TaxID=67277 RepID=A0ABW0A7B1_9ACTN